MKTIDYENAILDKFNSTEEQAISSILIDFVIEKIEEMVKDEDTMSIDQTITFSSELVKRLFSDVCSKADYIKSKIDERRAKRNPKELTANELKTIIIVYNSMVRLVELLNKMFVRENASKKYGDVFIIREECIKKIKSLGHTLSALRRLILLQNRGDKVPYSDFLL